MPRMHGHYVHAYAHAILHLHGCANDLTSSSASWRVHATQSGLGLVFLSKASTSAGGSSKRAASGSYLHESNTQRRTPDTTFRTPKERRKCKTQTRQLAHIRRTQGKCGYTMGRAHLTGHTRNLTTSGRRSSFHHQQCLSVSLLRRLRASTFQMADDAQESI